MNPPSPPSPSEGLRRLGATLVNLFPNWEVRLAAEAECPLSEARKQALRLGGDAVPRLFLADLHTAPLGRQDTARRWALAAMRPAGRLPFSLSAAGVIGCSWVGEALDRLTTRPVSFRWPREVLAGDESVALVEAERVGAALAVAISFDHAFIDQFAQDASGPHANPTHLLVAATVLENFENPAPGRVALENYRKRCGTLGAQVRSRPVGNVAAGGPSGEAVGVTLDGDLILRTAAGDRAALNPARNELL